MNNALDTLLRHVVRPARYAGAEWNGQTKDWASTALHVVLVHLDLYEVGISSPRLTSVHHQLQRDPRVLGDRVYAPAWDMVQALRSAGEPLFARGSHRPLSAFDAVLVELGRELAWTSLYPVLDLGGIPSRQAEREDHHPLVLGWASETTNPEPLADALDAVLLGDAEAILPDILEALDAAGRASRATRLQHLSQIPGVYVPSFYEPRYGRDGRFKEIRHASPTGPSSVARRFLATLPPVPTQPPVPWTEAVRDWGTMEVQRGCASLSSTHLLGLSAPPVRQREAEEAHAALSELIRNTGYEEVALSAPFLNDTLDVEAYLRPLIKLCRETRTMLHLPPLPAHVVTPGLLRHLATSPRPTLILAPEPVNAARLTALTEEDEGRQLQEALRSAQDSLAALRLTFIAGHPTEGEDDGKRVAHFVQSLRSAAGKRTRLRVSVHPFVPRANTPYERSPQTNPEILRPHLQALRKSASRVGASLSYTDPTMAYVEGALARGDRRVGAALRAASEAGSYLDTWRENFNVDRWHAAFAQAGLTLASYAQGYTPRSPLPWGHLTPGHPEPHAPHRSSPAAS